MWLRFHGAGECPFGPAFSLTWRNGTVAFLTARGTANFHTAVENLPSRDHLIRFVLPLDVLPTALAALPVKRGDQQDHREAHREGFAGAATLLSRTHGLSPGRADVALDLISVLLASQQYVDAQKIAEQVAEDHPDNTDLKLAKILSGYCFAFYRRDAGGDPMKYLAEKRALQESHSDSAAIVYNLAHMLQENGMAIEARPYWRAFRAMDGESAWADEASFYSR